MARSIPWHANWHLRLLFMGTVMVAAFGVLVWRLREVQVRDCDLYTSRLASRSEIRVRVPPVRGEIRDRNGLLLAENCSSFDIEFYLPEMVRAYGERYGSVPITKYEGPVHGMAKLLHEPDIVEIVDTAVIPRLRELGLPSNYDPDALKRHFRTDAEVPFVFVKNADFATVAKFSEHSLGLPGVSVSTHPIRHYLYGAFAAHVLGYVGEPQEISKLSDVQEFAFYEPNVEGKAQLEQSLDKYLRGTPGARLMERNLKGVIDKELSVEPSRAGDTVVLTLDARIQFITEQALRAVGRAGAVVVDPNNGDILAMASVPSFDPNAFIPSIAAADWQKVIEDPTDPLVNRAVCAFPPGSTFKVITALAGLRRGLAKSAFTCSGGVSYGNHYFKCWNGHGHGRLTLSDAIKVSCNAYFYQYGNAAGIDSIDTVGSLLGLGQIPQLGLTGEEPGILPGPDWLKLHASAERWSAAQTANVSIGQGYDLVSPLQLVMAYSAVANGGTAYEPRLVGKIIDSDGWTPDDFAAAPRIRGRLADVGVNPADIELVRTGFWKVVNEDGGTAGKARLPGGIVAGKTGTAQAQLRGKQDTIAWFVGFAPYERPRYAVCVMVQGGAHGGSVAAPIAARILQETLAMESGAYQPQLAALPPAQHDNPFRMIEAVKLANSAAHAPLVNDEEPAGTGHVATRALQSKLHFAAPRTKQTVPERPGSTLPPPTPTSDRRNLFQRIFHPRTTS
jgi:penicillin-binding protein 2